MDQHLDAPLTTVRIADARTAVQRCGESA